jgi:hypothetical protein
MELGFTAVMLKQTPSLSSGSQKRHPDPKKAQQVQSNADCVVWLWGRNSLWISTSWPDGEQGMLSKGDERWEEARRKIMTTLWCIPADSWFSHKTRDEARLPASALTRPCTSLHPPEIHTERTIIWVCRGDRENSLEELRKIPKEAFQKCFQNWKKLSERCIKIGGEHFEEDRAE